MKSKMFMFFFVFMILSGCTYHKAMDEQSRRQAIIEKNMENEYKISNMQSKEKSNLEMEVTKLKRDLFALDAEIESINESMKQAIQQEQKIEKKQKEQNKQKLVALEQRKLILMKDISDKKAIIEIM